MAHRFRYGNLARVGLKAGAVRGHQELTLVAVLNAMPNTDNSFYTANCVAVRDGTPYFGVPVMGLGQPLDNSMGLLLFPDADGTNPVLLPLGW